LLFKRIPKPSSSFSIIFLCPKGFRTSRTIKIKLHVRATEESKKKTVPQQSSIKPLILKYSNRGVFLLTLGR
jgi:hypothetical protein